MADNYLIDDVSNGNVKISEEVIATIAVVAVEEVEGVVELQSTLKTSVTDMLGVKNLSKGIKVEIGEKQAIIDIFVIVQYGKNIIEIGKEVQKSVKEAVENMTGLDVVEVNVHIGGVAIENKEKIKA